MSKIISQDTFDDIVKENVVEFSMSQDEAKRDTVKQFEAQGVNLSNIIQDLTINPITGSPILNETIDKLKNYTNAQLTEPNEFVDYLIILDKECKKSIAHRVLAAKNGAFIIIIRFLKQELLQNEIPRTVVLVECLKVANSLCNKQPDLFDAEAISLAFKCLDLPNKQILMLAIQWMQKACIMHESNRQEIIAAGILEKIKPLVTTEQISQLLREILALFRYLILDDDIRVEFGCAHEHARQIANRFIVDLTKLLGVYNDPDLLADLILTLGSLSVRQEFCETIEKSGGLNYVFEIMNNNPNAARVNREAMKFLRALAGNDIIKFKIVENGRENIIKNVLTTNLERHENVVVAVLACISTLTLRAKENSSKFFKIGIAETVVESVRIYLHSKLVVRNASWAIRNMVSRSRDQCQVWLSLGIEELLKKAMNDHSTIQQDIKAALRDLGCNVELKEEFTGVAEKKILNK